jgi:putative transposase
MIVDAARRRIRDRGGNAVLKRGSATRQILDELTELTAAPTDRAVKGKLAAASRRVEQSRIDHDEARHASDDTDHARSSQPNPRMSTEVLRRVWPNLLDEPDG